MGCYNNGDTSIAVAAEWGKLSSLIKEAWVFAAISKGREREK